MHNSYRIICFTHSQASLLCHVQSRGLINLNHLQDSVQNNRDLFLSICHNSCNKVYLKTQELTLKHRTQRSFSHVTKCTTIRYQHPYVSQPTYFAPFQHWNMTWALSSAISHKQAVSEYEEYTLQNCAQYVRKTSHRKFHTKIYCIKSAMQTNDIEQWENLKWQVEYRAKWNWILTQFREVIQGEKNAVKSIFCARIKGQFF